MAEWGRGGRIVPGQFAFLLVQKEGGRWEANVLYNFDIDGVKLGSLERVNLLAVFRGPIYRGRVGNVETPL